MSARAAAARPALTRAQIRPFVEVLAHKHGATIHHTAANGFALALHRGNLQGGHVEMQSDGAIGVTGNASELAEDLRAALSLAKEPVCDQRAQMPDPQPELCPWLVNALCGTVIVSGRARLPEGFVAPTHTHTTSGDTRPMGVFAWDADRFTVTFENVLDEDAGHMLERINFTLDDVARRIDSFLGRAPAALESSLSLHESARLECVDGVPIAVLTERCETDGAERAVRAVFPGRVEIGAWGRVL